MLYTSAETVILHNREVFLFMTGWENNTMATKSDMLRLESEIKTLEVKIAKTKADLIRWVVGAGFLQTALIALLLIKLIK